MVKSTIIRELHDTIILNDAALAQYMIDLLQNGGKRITAWHAEDGAVYDYYEMVLVKEGERWIFRVTRDNTKLEASAQKDLQGCIK